MYDAMFAAGLRLPLTAPHRQLVDYLGLSVSQIAPTLGGLLLEQRYCGEVLVGGTISSRWTSSFTVTGLTTYLLPRGHTILPSGRRT